MFCACGDICDCETSCSCQTSRCSCTKCNKLKKRLCDHCHCPIRKVTRVRSKDDLKFCKCLWWKDREKFATSQTTEAGSDTACSVKSNCESRNNQIAKASSTPHDSSLNGRESRNSKNKNSEISSENQRRRSLFSTLKRKFRKMKSRIKSKNQNDFSSLNVILELGNESTEESVETVSSNFSSYSPIPRGKFSKDHEYGSREILFMPEVDNVEFSYTQSYQNLEQTALAKPLTPSLIDESFENSLSEQTGTFDSKQASGVHSSLSKGSMFLQSIFVPLHTKRSLPNLQKSENVTSPTSNNRHEDLKSPEIAICSTNNLSDCDNLPVTQSLDAHSTDKVVFSTENLIKSRLPSDKDLLTFEDEESSILSPSISQELLSSSEPCNSYLYSEPSAALDWEIFETFNCELQGFPQVPVFRSPTVDSNEFRESSSMVSTGTTSSSGTSELHSAHHSYSLSQLPLLLSQSCSSAPRTRSLTTFAGSLTELPLYCKSSTSLDSSYEDKDLEDTSASHLASSDLNDDFETFSKKSSKDSTDSDSSPEILPCSSFRSKISSLIFHSKIPYQPLR